MRTKPRPPHRLATAISALALALLALPALAAELTVASYVDLTIDRLELARDTWAAEGRSPVETEEAAVCQLYETDLQTYYRFAGKHRQEIEDYLAAHDDLTATLDALAAEIARLIEQKEAQQ